MGFSLFSKNRIDGKEGKSDRLVEAPLTPTPRPAASTTAPVRAAENLAEIRKRQAEMTAKIDAIESEMTAEFPPLQQESLRKMPQPVPAGVVLPAAARRDPGAAAGSPSAPGSMIQTFISTTFNSDFLTIDGLKPGNIELSENNSLPALGEEVAILYASGQWNECVRALKDELAQESDKSWVWLMLFEVYQQTDKQQEFESLAIDYSLKFESSPPAWRDLHQDPPDKKAPVAVAAAARPSEVLMPARMTAEQQRELDAFKKMLKPGASAQLNLSQLNEVDEAGAQVLREILQLARTTPLPITISGATQAAFALRSKLVINLRQPPESVWLAALDLYQILAWEQPFEDLAVDYAVTFEVSPPSYQPPPPHVHIAGNMSRDAIAAVDVADLVNTRPQLKGDIIGTASDAIATLEAAAALNPKVEVDCSQLGRVDFTAAGALLNWLFSAQERGQHFSFVQVHVLAAALFTIVGINSITEIASRRS